MRVDTAPLYSETLGRMQGDIEAGNVSAVHLSVQAFKEHVMKSH